MRYVAHQHYGTGFCVVTETVDELPILEAGEVWAPDHWAIDWHCNLGWELFLQVKGASLWETDRGQLAVPEHGAYFLQQGLRHRLVKFLGKPENHFYYLIFPAGEIPDFCASAPCWNSEFSLLNDAHSLLLPMQGLLREITTREIFQQQVCRFYLDALCANLARLTMSEPPKPIPGYHPAAFRTLRLLETKPEFPWRLQSLARMSGVSVPHLIELFRRNFGETPMKRLQALRLQEAHRQLQQTNKSVTEIAHELSFSSSQHLARSFKLAFGITPTSLRQRPTCPPINLGTDHHPENFRG